MRSAVVARSGVSQTADDELARSFSALVSAEWERAVGLAYHLTSGDRAAAQDVAQEACLRAHRALPTFRGEASLRTWFYRILLREAGRQRRWRAVRSRWDRVFGGELPSDAGREGETHAAPEVQGTDSLARRRIAAALASLSASQREIFALVHLEGLTVQEAADLVGRPLGTAKSHLHRALGKMRHALADLRLEDTP